MDVCHHSWCFQLVQHQSEIIITMWRPCNWMSSANKEIRMRKVSIVALAAAAISVAVLPALAHGGEDEDHDQHSPSGYGIPGYGTGKQLPGYTQTQWGQSYRNYWDQHPQEHTTLLQSENQLHALLQNGVITQQEHQMLDQQLQVDHAVFDGRQPSPFVQSYAGQPLINPMMPSLLQRIHTHLGQAPGGYPVAPGMYSSGTYPVQAPGHTNDPRYNQGHNNSLGHQLKDAVNSNWQGGGPGYGTGSQPGYAQLAGGWSQGYRSYWSSHPQEHTALLRSESEIHSLVQQGLISPQEHQLLDQQWQVDHAVFDNRQATPFVQNYNGSPYVSPMMPELMEKLSRYFGL